MASLSRPAKWERFLALLHRTILCFERHFSQPPEILRHGRTVQQEIGYRYQQALDLRFTYPQQARIILLQLLGQLQDDRLDPNWVKQRLGRIYFQLGNLDSERNLRIHHYQKGLENMPDHYRCREILTQLLEEQR